MPWSYEHHQQSDVVEVLFEGVIDTHDLKSLTTELIQMEKDKGVNRFLLDCTTMELDASVSLIDVYNLPAKQYLEEEADRFAKVAVMHAESHNTDHAIDFYEMVCQNRGWLVEAFSDRDAALAWLASGTSSRWVC